MKYVTSVEKKFDFLRALNIGLYQKGFQKKRDKLWPSSASQCIRRNTLQNDEICETMPDDTDSIRHMYQELGKFIESQVIQSFSNLKLVRATDYYMPKLPELNISGKIDLIVEADNELIGVEVKSRGSDLPVKETDIQQAKIYSIATGLPFCVAIIDRNVRKMGRPGLNALFRTITIEEPEKREILFNLYLSQLYISKNAIFPFANSPFGSKVCEYCPFAGICDKYKLKTEFIPSNDDILKINEQIDLVISQEKSRKEQIYKELIDARSNQAL